MADKCEKPDITEKYYTFAYIKYVLDSLFFTVMLMQMTFVMVRMLVLREINNKLQFLPSNAS